MLWYAGPSDGHWRLTSGMPSMTHGIPADVRIFDLTGDGFADRMYAGDMGGRVWRFDIHNGQTRANLVTGGVFASLGNAHLGTHPVATTRRFYSAPDVAFLADGGRTWLNIAIGSGYRGHPLNTQMPRTASTALRDYQPFARLTQAQYDAATVITEADVNLIDITTDITPTIPPGATGWRLDLRRPGAWTGEKSLSEARTIESMIQFTTYEPQQRLDAGHGEPARPASARTGSTRSAPTRARRCSTARARKTRRIPWTTASPSSPRAASRRKWSGSSPAPRARAWAPSAAPTRCASSASKTAASASTSPPSAPSGGRLE